MRTFPVTVPVGLLVSLLSFATQLCSVAAFCQQPTKQRLLSSSRQRPSRVATTIRAERSDDEEDGKEEDAPSDISWLKNAMDSPSPMEPDGLVVVETKQGISGFAVDPERGFVVVLVGGDRATYTVVSPKDKQQVRSAEALCLVQLAGGMDLGTPVLPPDLLAGMVADEIEGDARELRQKVRLRRVDVIANKEDQNAEQRKQPSATPRDSTPERDNKIEEQAPKVATAIQKLPGLEESTMDQIMIGLKSHADENGQVDREGFTELLHTLRALVNAVEPSKVQFNLVVAYNGEEQQQELVIPAPSTVAAIGLAMRYKAPVVVAEECQAEGFDVVEIASRFPAFRPMQELLEDAKIMDAFIPALFNEANAPDNDDKM